VLIDVTDIAVAVNLCCIALGKRGPECGWVAWTTLPSRRTNAVWGCLMILSPEESTA
jgi:hypothetical protein